MAKHRKIKLGDIIKPRKEKASPADFPDLPFIGMEHVEAHTMRLLGTVPASTMRSSANRFYAGDVLYGRLRPYLNKVYKTQFDGLCSAEFIVFPKMEEIHPDFLRYRLNAHDFVSFATHLNTGDRPRVDFDGISSFEFFLPSSLEEQQSIVAAIDTQFSRLDEAVTALKRMQANLKRYKAAVLTAAVQGKLTEKWRKEHPEAEPADQLLKRILAERRAKWEAEELAKMKAKGKKSKDDSWKKKYKEPAEPDTANLPELPEGWVWATAIQACDPVVDCHNKTAPYADSGIPLVRTSNIRDGRLSYDDIRFVDQPTYDFWSRRCPPKSGDVLFTREAPMGEAAVIPKGITLCMGQRMMLMRPSNATTSFFLLTTLMSPVIKRIIDLTAVGSGVKHMRVGDVELLPLPLPPVPEQNVIVAELDRRLSVTEELEATIETSLKRAERLRQAILSMAFSGKHRIKQRNHSGVGKYSVTVTG